MDSLWTYLPVYLAGGLFIVGIVYERRHPGTERARRLMSILLGAALVLCFGTVLVNLGRSVLDGATGLIIPLVLITALMVLSAITTFKGLRPRLATTTDAEQEGRRSSVRVTLTLVVFVALMAYGAGFLAGYWISQLKPELEGMSLTLGAAAVGIVALTLVPWATVKYRAALRRRTVANGHPASPEGVEYVMKKATAARLAADLNYGSFSPFRPLILGAVAVFAVLITPVLMRLVFTTLGETTGEPAPAFDFAMIQTISIVLALLVVLVGLIGYMLVPVLLEVKVEYQLAALSPQQRLQWEDEQRSEHVAEHQFPRKLADPDRSIRVLTVTASGDVQLEQLPAGTLLRMHSEPVPDPEETELADLEFLDDLDSGLQSVARVLLSLREHMGSREFDLFGDEPADTLHIVVVGDDDYLDFPDDLAAKLIDAA
ncbi:MAG: hypothetical protein ABS81_03985 [Pseudonocardia sp. SCN 72-86]|uniref:hypothetical protein n=1 Tax=uncultured Microbacterium sp. TaxID=191216 RepID=UPI00086C555B|nr:hypothetical protein [uncultured Microbacterium sp.]ODU06779.1 MAG: hypothetical protein ABS81_03985 [Pseudonocardia sp. SCN 72-86]